MSGKNRVTDWSDRQVFALVAESFDTTEVSWIASGHWSDCFAFRSNEQDLVVRLGRHGEDFRKDHRAANFARSGLPIPTVYSVGEVDGLYYAVSERVPGTPLEQTPDWHSFIDAIADLFDALRAVDLAGLSGWGDWASTGRAPASNWREYLLQINQDPATSRVHGWAAALQKFPTSAALFNDWYERLDDIASADVPRSVVHNDLINRNVHVFDKQISGVFDWGNSLVGDHLYDLALLRFWQPWLPHVRDVLLMETLHERWAGSQCVQNFETRFDACLIHIGLQHMAYHAFLQDFDEMHAVADRISAVIDG